MRKRLLVLGFTVIFLVVCAAGVWWRLFSKEANFVLINHNQSRDVTRAFSMALMEDRIETLESVVHPDEQQLIEDWVGDHEAVTTCAAPPWDLENPPWFAVGSTSADGNSRVETLTLSLPCPDRDRYYCLRIEDIALQRTEDGWKVYDWGKVSESWHPYSCN